ncbi:hypothetical protein HPB51_013112 [Rhipicephalus microplus]|uniref:Uncharacterized protein n=1 Tax=Rhipicephalus microplus TaxID=6941 RepID=A0A9J6F288_RHIMP|nr:hypothetical protein HPB51_013112 [Rhipicephalus microplus]
MNARECHSVHDFIVAAGKVNFATCESSSGQEHVASLSPGSASNSSTSFVGEKYAGSSSASLSVPTQQTQLAVMGLDDESVIAPVESLPEVSPEVPLSPQSSNSQAHMDVALSGSPHATHQLVPTASLGVPPVSSHLEASSQQALLDRIAQLERLQENTMRKLVTARKRYLKSENEKSCLKKRIRGLFNEDQMRSVERLSTQGMRWEASTLVHSLRLRLMIPWL